MKKIKMKWRKMPKDYEKQMAVWDEFLLMLNEKYGKENIVAMAEQAYHKVYGSTVRVEPHPCDPSRKCSPLYHCLQCDPGEPI